MIRLSPFPEELDQGYLGRLMRVNGYKNENKFIRAAAKECNLPLTSLKKGNRLLALSGLAGKTTEEFTRLHTLVPFHKAITNSRPDVPFGCRSAPSALEAKTSKAWQKRIFFCRLCAEEDLQFHGMSYWRRDHQITGQVWCPKHRIGLGFVSAQRKVLRSPYSLRAEAHAIEGSFVEETIKNAAVNRFLDIACELMQRSKSLPGVAAAIEIRTEAEKRGLLVSDRKESLDLMSEFVKSSYPATWLAVTLPQVANKASGSPIEAIAEVLIRKSRAWTSVSYLLLAAAVYEDSNEALASLMTCEQKNQVELQRQRRMRTLIAEKRGRELAEEKLSCPVETIINVYAQNLGRPSRIARSLNARLPQTKQALALLGLPNLSKQAKTGRLMAVAAELCVNGLNLQECSKSTNVSLKELSKLDLDPDSILMRAWRLMLLGSSEKNDVARKSGRPSSFYSQTVKA